MINTPTIIHNIYTVSRHLREDRELMIQAARDIPINERDGLLAFYLTSYSNIITDIAEVLALVTTYEREIEILRKEGLRYKWSDDRLIELEEKILSFQPPSDV